MHGNRHLKLKKKGFGHWMGSLAFKHLMINEVSLSTGWGEWLPSCVGHSYAR
jgi:hypothetical protein